MNKMNKIKIFADGSNITEIFSQYENNPLIKGFTTNPTLMRRAGVKDYLKFVKEVTSKIKDYSISFEVFADSMDEMESQAYKLNDISENIWVKIPVTNTKSESTSKLVEKLTDNGVKVNVTAIFTLEQVKEFYNVISPSTESIISIFAGRIANAGIDPEPIVREAVNLCKSKEKIEVLWASPREAFNILQAERVGCHIITATSDIINASNTFGKDLNEYSLETVKMFYNDAQLSGYNL